jgi:hypothetical protein
MKVGPPPPPTCTHGNDGRIRYLIAGGYGSLNLDWFGQSDAFSGRAFSYNLDAAFEFQKLTFKARRE